MTEDEMKRKVREVEYRVFTELARNPNATALDLSTLMLGQFSIDGFDNYLKALQRDGLLDLKGLTAQGYNELAQLRREFETPGIIPKRTGS